MRHLPKLIGLLGVLILSLFLVTLPVHATLGTGMTNTEVLLSTPLSVVPSGQYVSLTARSGNQGTDQLEIENLTTQRTWSAGSSPTLEIRTTAVVNGPTTQVFVAKLVNEATQTVDAWSAPVHITFDLAPNGSNAGYRGLAGNVTAGILHLGPATTSQSPSLFLGENGYTQPVYQYWEGGPQGWHGTPFSPWPSYQYPSLANGLYAVTGYVKNTSDPDAKPYLAKAHTYWIAANQPIPAGFSLRSDVISEGQSVTVTAPAGYAAYQWWWAPQAGQNGHWDSSGPYQATGQTYTLYANMPGSLKIVAYGREPSGRTQELGTLYVNVNQ